MHMKRVVWLSWWFLSACLFSHSHINFVRALVSVTSSRVCYELSCLLRALVSVTSSVVLTRLPAPRPQFLRNRRINREFRMSLGKMGFCPALLKGLSSEHIFDPRIEEVSKCLSDSTRDLTSISASNMTRFWGSISDPCYQLARVGNKVQKSKFRSNFISYLISSTPL